MDKINTYFSVVILFSSVALILSILFIKIYILLAKKLKFFSTPHQGGVRQDTIPTSGGISFGLVYIVMILILNLFHQIPQAYLLSIIIGSSLMLITGFIDDIYSLSSIMRLIIQLIFVILVCFLFDIQNSFQNNIDYFIVFPAIIFGSIWIINTFNFIDGADGLVSINSAIFSFVGGIYLLLTNDLVLSSSLFILFTVNIGFLFFNWSPAKIFMGDSGSLLLGSLFVIFIIGSYAQGSNIYWVWLTLLSIFYVETTVTLFVRIWRKENVFSVHHSLHAYQQIIINSGIHSRPALISILINFLWTVPMSFLSFIYPEFGALIVLVTCLPLSLIFYFFGPYQTKSIS
tara:strand:- start:4786 stop:5820 length:1035 start_codon:yes stop_codon:yes gene_type:complete